MLKFIGKALVGMVLTKEARQVAGPLAQSALSSAINTALKREAAEVRPQPVINQAAEEEAASAARRAALIRQAMEIRAAKQTLLQELNEQDRNRLLETAMRAFGKPEA